MIGLAPIVSDRTVVLILGSFPSARSLAEQRYYAHPQNQFWRILQAIWPSKPMPMCADSYQNRSKWLLDRGLGLWDVYAACERVGSLDTAIRNSTVNDFAGLQRRLPRLACVAHNGGESFRHAGRIDGLDFPAHRLPSTSPANASWRIERKLAAWRDLMVRYKLVQ